ncbi:MAG: hypothetical protein GVX96_04060 [Bacteroidetes bacterium]|jgi:hypothetical protein|nr:hypothetical protein [Bacteroidota bacterium]
MVASKMDLTYRLLAYYLMFVCLFFGISESILAQKYNLSAGMRLGTEVGLTTVGRIAKKHSLESVLQYSTLYHATRLSINHRRHHGFLGRRFNLYLGSGAGYSWYHSLDPEGEGTSNPHANISVGVEGVLGRTHISWDYRPTYSFGGTKVFYSETALSLRYVIIKKKWRPFKRLRNIKPFWKK